MYLPNVFYNGGYFLVNNIYHLKDKNLLTTTIKLSTIKLKQIKSYTDIYVKDEDLQGNKIMNVQRRILCRLF